MFLVTPSTQLRVCVYQHTVCADIFSSSSELRLNIFQIHSGTSGWSRDLQGKVAPLTKSAVIPVPVHRYRLHKNPRAQNFSEFRLMTPDISIYLNSDPQYSGNTIPCVPKEFLHLTSTCTLENNCFKLSRNIVPFFQKYRQKYNLKHVKYMLHYCIIE